MARRKSALELVRTGRRRARPQRRNRLNFFELAYQQIEDLLVTCELKPGHFLTMQELQHITGFGRTPVHSAVNRLAADTLIIIRPRHGLQIAPIDLARERMLLALRRDMERFVVRLAAERASLSHRNQALHIERVLSERRATLTIDEFNKLRPPHRCAGAGRRRRAVPGAHAAAAAHDLSPHRLHLPPLHAGPCRSLRHDRPPSRHSQRGRRTAASIAAVKASDALIDFMDQMFTGMETGIDPRLLDCSIEPLLGT